MQTYKILAILLMHILLWPCDVTQPKMAPLHNLKFSGIQTSETFLLYIGF